MTARDKLSLGLPRVTRVHWAVALWFYLLSFVRYVGDPCLHLALGCHVTYGLRCGWTGAVLSRKSHSVFLHSSGKNRK